MDYVPDNLSAPALKWNAMLNITKFELELISYGGMHLIFEKGMKGRFSYISKRYSKANNSYIKLYDPNNLYGYGMSKFLPKSRFKWVDPK